MKQGSKYGLHRVLSPKGVLPQAADVIANDMTIYDNEILIDVDALNIDSASFRQLSEEAAGDEEKIAAKIMEIVNERGKMQNPVTGSGGMLIGRVSKIGKSLEGKIDLLPGDKIATLVSLSLTPLKIERIVGIKKAIDRVDIVGQAILFESGIYAKLPDDLSESVALAALDVAGAPAQMAKLVSAGQHVLIVGTAGKSGTLCAAVAKEKAGEDGVVVGCDLYENGGDFLLQHGYLDHYFAVDATAAGEVLEKALSANGQAEYDVAVVTVNAPGSEMSAILPVKDGGIVYFFSMATSFTKAALGAEGVGKDVSMLIGNGYTKGHADYTIELLRREKPLRDRFESVYC
ncbi:MAG TPA: L-erythro-3,5-diaminohexanoate dehydrogenase [Fastidiosipila sp.]|jgi:L-erythro-3,5-diaminohexanoate dehydrogenase|nr:L-erythro-3,5-diaminohexanoate dehydrogenase [Fastidiosipila sp.]